MTKNGIQFKNRKDNLVIVAFNKMRIDVIENFLNQREGNLEMVEALIDDTKSRIE